MRFMASVMWQICLWIKQLTLQEAAPSEPSEKGHPVGVGTYPLVRQLHKSAYLKKKILLGLCEKNLSNIPFCLLYLFTMESKAGNSEEARGSVGRNRASDWWTSSASSSALVPWEIVITVKVFQGRDRWKGREKLLSDLGGSDMKVYVHKILATP